MAVDMSASNALEAAIDAKIAKAAPKRTQANGTVKRVDADGTAYVQLEGADVDTPVARTAAALKVGQEVGGTVRNGELVIDGNYSAPATDDTRAIQAQDTARTAIRDAARATSAAEMAEQSAAAASDAANRAIADAGDAATAAGEAKTSAGEAKAAADAANNNLKSVVSGATTVEKAVSVMQTALEAVVDYDPATDTTQEWFWHDANGAHVLGDTSGYRNDVTSTGMDIVEVATEDSVARFGADGARIGEADKIATYVTRNGLSVRSESGNGGNPFFSVTMPETATDEKIPFYIVYTSSSSFPDDITLTYEDDQGTVHYIDSVYDLFKIEVRGYDTLPIITQDIVLTITESGNLSGNGGMLPSYVTGYNATAHTITVDKVGDLAAALDAHPYAAVIGILGRATSYEQPRMLFDVDGGGSLYADFRSLQLINKEGDTYFHVSDLRDVEGWVQQQDEWHGERGDRVFNLSYTPVLKPGSSEILQLTIGGVEQSASSYTLNGRTLTLGIALTAAADVVASYNSTDDEADALTFGSRQAIASTNIGALSSAFGKGNEASGAYSLAEGRENVASGTCAYAGGQETEATAPCAHAEGYRTVAGSQAAHAQNYCTEAGYWAQTAMGRFNANDPYNALEIGNGTSDTTRSNALAVDWSGNALIAGEVQDMSGNAKYTKTRVKGNAETAYRAGDVNLTPANIGALALSGGTLTGGLTVNGPVASNNDTFYAKSTVTAFDRDGAVPASDTWKGGLNIRDVDDDVFAQLTAVKRNAANGGWNELGLYVYGVNSSGTQIQNNLNLKIKSDGSKAVTLDAASWRTAIGLDSLLVNATGSQASGSIAAGGTANVTVAITVPSGYTIAAIRRVSSGNAYVDIAGYYISGNSVVVALHNSSTSSRSGTTTVNCMCVKTAFWG